ncbi:hypothetical protein IHE45_19G028200 [Dioscorea alata]|uniref:Uncharacterized protein n=1 Tax=Dioscorea alata TaxID=55571 RepID=A0ACB7TX17_DIOAL|nr:hypothetical protein IHE45_19G028200 [Dioscorea alata]
MVFVLLKRHVRISVRTDVVELNSLHLLDNDKLEVLFTHAIKNRDDYPDWSNSLRIRRKKKKRNSGKDPDWNREGFESSPFSI